VLSKKATPLTWVLVVVFLSITAGCATTTTLMVSKVARVTTEPINPVRVVVNKASFLQCGRVGWCTGGFIKNRNGSVVQIDNCFGCVSSFQLFFAAMTNDLEVLNRFDWMVLPRDFMWVQIATDYQGQQI